LIIAPLYSTWLVTEANNSHYQNPITS